MKIIMEKWKTQFEKKRNGIFIHILYMYNVSVDIYIYIYAVIFNMEFK